MASARAARSATSNTPRPTRASPTVSAEPQRLLLADAQTSGGLLIAIPQAKLAGLVADLKQRGTLAAAVIGSIVAADKPGVIEVGA